MSQTQSSHNGICEDHQVFKSSWTLHVVNVISSDIMYMLLSRKIYIMFTTHPLIMVLSPVRCIKIASQQPWSFILQNFKNWIFFKWNVHKLQYVYMYCLISYQWCSGTFQLSLFMKFLIYSFDMSMCYVRV